MRYFWIVLALLFSSISSAQADLISKKGPKYFYQDQQYKCKEMQPVFEKSPAALDIYLSARSNYSAAGFMGYAGLGMIVVGGGLGLGIGTLESAILGALSIVGGLVIEISALIPLARGSAKMKKAINTFNYEMIEKHGYGKDVSLSFGVTGHGVGLVYQF